MTHEVASHVSQLRIRHYVTNIYDNFKQVFDFKIKVLFNFFQIKLYTIQLFDR